MRAFFIKMKRLDFQIFMSNFQKQGLFLPFRKARLPVFSCPFGLLGMPQKSYSVFAATGAEKSVALPCLACICAECAIILG